MQKRNWKFYKRNSINTSNWNTMTDKIITVLKNNYPNKSNDVVKKKSEYTKNLINKQTHLNYEIFGRKKKLITSNNKILIYKVFKAWKHVKQHENVVMTHS